METTIPGAATTPADHIAGLPLEIPSSGRGKIAALDGDIRKELNVRLEDGQQAPEILPWLNGLHEVREILKHGFKGVPISPQNLSAWRRGGFLFWLWQAELRQDTHLLREGTEELQESLQYDCTRRRPTLLVDDLLSQFTARVASFMLRWNGCPDDPQWASFTKVGNFLTKLQNACHRAEREAIERPERLRIAEEQEDNRILKEIAQDVRREEYEEAKAENAKAAKAKKARKEARSSSVKANQASDSKPADPAIIENVDFGKETPAADSSSSV
jgi:hypothetical protein